MSETPKRIQERRRSVRIIETLPFQIGHQGFEIETRTLNLSVHGAMCVVAREIPMMTQLGVVLILPAGRASRHKKVRIRGVVVRKEKDPASGKFFLAIYFADMKPEDRKTLEKFIQSRLNVNP